MFYILRTIQFKKISMVCSARFVFKLRNPSPSVTPPTGPSLRWEAEPWLDCTFCLSAPLTLVFSHRLKWSPIAVDFCQRVYQLGVSLFRKKLLSCLT